MLDDPGLIEYSSCVAQCFSDLSTWSLSARSYSYPSRVLVPIAVAAYKFTKSCEDRTSGMDERENQLVKNNCLYAWPLLSCVPFLAERQWQQRENVKFLGNVFVISRVCKVCIATCIWLQEQISFNRNSINQSFFTWHAVKERFGKSSSCRTREHYI